MTNEDKLAEKWLDERYLKDTGDRKPCKEAFIAGLKAGREIEKQKRMTNKELSRWLREKPTREYKYLTSDYICHNYDYRETIQDTEVHEDIRIREGDEDWHIPIKENERKER